MQALFKVLVVALAAIPSTSALGIVEFFQNNACSVNEVDSNTGAGCVNINVGLHSFLVTDNSAALVEILLFSEPNCRVPCQNFTVPGNSPCEPITHCGAGALSFIGTEL